MAHSSQPQWRRFTDDNPLEPLQVDATDILAEFMDVSAGALDGGIIPRLKAEGVLAAVPGQPDT